MRTVVLGPPPPELAALIARRQRLGQDLFDEVWDGEYHMSPAPHPRHGLALTRLLTALRPVASAANLVEIAQFNLGRADDYRVPDAGYLRDIPTETYVPTAAIVVEVVSPGDETYDKFSFYADRCVDEIVIADPSERVVRWFERDGAAYRESPTSRLLAAAATDLTNAIDWP